VASVVINKGGVLAAVVYANIQITDAEYKRLINNYQQ
jgi:hypothetical protein